MFLVKKMKIEKPIIHAVRMNRHGSYFDSVSISVMDDGAQLVVVSTAYHGSGAASGHWPKGFVSGDFPSDGELNYFCSNFGFEIGMLTRSELNELNALYVGARNEVVKQLALHFYSNSGRVRGKAV